MSYLEMPTYRAHILQSQAYRVLWNFKTEFLATYDLSLSEWKTLGHLNETGRFSPAEISSILGVKSPISSRILNSLEAKHLVKRSISKKDRRAVEVSITNEGKKLVTKVESRLRPALKNLLAPISRQDLEIYLKVTSQIANQL